VNCSDIADWLDACVDGELDPVHDVEVERHVQQCEQCSSALQEQRALREAIVAGAPVFRAPTALRERIEASLRERRPPVGFRLPLGLGVGLAASLALVALLGWTLGRNGAAPAPDDVLVGEVVSAHVRSLMADHLTDVPSSDRHVVRPWFNGKLDFSPPAVDLAAQGFPLVGGRLDYLQDRSVAALVYRHGEHPLNLFIWPSGGGTSGAAADHPVREFARDGYQLSEWTGAGMTFCAVSDLNREELREFVRLLQSQG
jgi:anti-sigma factor RsiW